MKTISVGFKEDRTLYINGKTTESQMKEYQRKYRERKKKEKRNGLIFEVHTLCRYDKNEDNEIEKIE